MCHRRGHVERRGFTERKRTDLPNVSETLYGGKILARHEGTKTKKKVSEDLELLRKVPSLAEFT